MYLVGLTGGVATGKSTVSNMFRDLGVPVIDADAMARRIVEPGRKAWRAIKEEFGPCVFHDNGELNRAALRTIIFEDEGQRQKLNRITHPEIYKEMWWEAVKCAASGHQYIIMDLPLLFEVRLSHGCIFCQKFLKSPKIENMLNRPPPIFKQLLEKEKSFSSTKEAFLCLFS